MDPAPSWARGWTGVSRDVASAYEAAIARLAQELSGASLRRDLRLVTARLTPVLAWLRAVLAVALSLAYRAAAGRVGAWAEELSIRRPDGSIDLGALARHVGTCASLGAIAVAIGAVIALI